MTRGDLRTTVLVRLGKDTTSAWTSEAMVNDEINIAHKWAAGQHKWPNTEGKVDTTFASLVTSPEGYIRGEYPEGWKSDSIRQLQIGGYLVGKRNFYKFCEFLEDNPADDERIYSDFARQYYINPNIDLSGTVTAWGQYTPADILDGDANDATETVFAGEEEANEAIIEKAISGLLRRDGQLKEAEEHFKLAQIHVESVWKRITDEQAMYTLPPGDGMFERIDVLQGDYYDDTLNENQF